MAPVYTQRLGYQSYFTLEGAIHQVHRHFSSLSVQDINLKPRRRTCCTYRVRPKAEHLKNENLCLLCRVQYTHQIQIFHSQIWQFLYRSRSATKTSIHVRMRAVGCSNPTHKPNCSLQYSSDQMSRIREAKG
jgi:hypothetical protein